MLPSAIIAPFLGFLFLSFCRKRFTPKLLGYFSCISVFYSFFIFCYLFIQFSQFHIPITYNTFSWLDIKNLTISVGFLLDNLSFVMVLIITGIGSLIHFYSIGYMVNEKSAYRYFSFLNLFIFFMLVLVSADNLVLVFLGWEGVGLCSYLLIGFYLDKKSASDAAKKAFIVNRIGDFSFIVALMLVYFLFGTFNFLEIQEAFQPQKYNEFLIFLTTLTIFFSAAGKSAQLPLHVWLPDAMEGPTPVSALIHAATMVTAGIYLIAKLHFVFVFSPTTLLVILAFGAFTALLGASIAIVQTDIKKILAYSTISQLGYMFMALGVGAFTSAIFHLLTHAFFKALLFLAAGALIYALSYEQDIRKMGKLKAKMPLIWLAFSVGSWCLAGLPLASGFFSKEEILFSIFQKGVNIGSSFIVFFFIIGMLTAFLSAIYSYRMMNLVFYSNERKVYSVQKINVFMRSVLQILILGSFIVGLLGLSHFFEKIGLQNIIAVYFSDFFNTTSIKTTQSFLPNWSFLIKELFVLGLSLLLAFLGFFWMLSKYRNRSYSPKKTRSFVYRLVENHFYIDHFYQFFIVLPLQKLSQVFYWLGEQKVMFWLIQGFSSLAVFIGSLFSRWHNGKIIRHSLIMIGGLVIMIYFFLFR